MSGQQSRLAAFVGHGALGAVGIAIGILLVTRAGEGVAAAIALVIAAYLGLSNLAAKAVHDGFKEQLKVLGDLTDSQKRELKTYIEELSGDVNAGWVAAVLGASLAGVAASCVFVPGMREVVAESARSSLLITAFGMGGIAIMPVLRMLRYWQQLHRLWSDVQELIVSQKRRMEAIEAIHSERQLIGKTVQHV